MPAEETAAEQPAAGSGGGAVAAGVAAGGEGTKPPPKKATADEAARQGISAPIFTQVKVLRAEVTVPYTLEQHYSKSLYVANLPNVSGGVCGTGSRGGKLGLGASV